MLIGERQVEACGISSGIELLQEVDPARRAGGDHRQRAFLEPREELVGLLDDRQVGAEVGVEHRGRTPAAAGR